MSAFINELKSYLTDVDWTSTVEKRVESIYTKHLPEPKVVYKVEIREVPLIEEPERVMTDDEVFTHVSTAVCETFKVTLEDLLNKNRSRDRVLARYICYFIMRNTYKLNLNKIGSYFRKDHTTVIHGINSIQNGLFAKDDRWMRYHQVLRSLFITGEEKP